MISETQQEDFKGDKTLSVSFKEHPKIRLKLKLFLIVFVLGGLIVIVGANEFNVESNPSVLFDYIILLGIIIGISAVTTLNIFVRCPRCKTRVFSVKMMWNNKMPVGRNNYCPVCGFPERDTRTISG